MDYPSTKRDRKGGTAAEVIDDEDAVRDAARKERQGTHFA